LNLKVTLSKHQGSENIVIIKLEASKYLENQQKQKQKVQQQH
jgi:hypothetical protein